MCRNLTPITVFALCLIFQTKNVKFMTNSDTRVSHNRTAQHQTTRPTGTSAARITTTATIIHTITITHATTITVIHPISTISMSSDYRASFSEIRWTYSENFSEDPIRLKIFLIVSRFLNKNNSSKLDHITLFAIICNQLINELAF